MTVEIWKIQLGVLLSFLGIWELVGISSLVSPVLVPRFSQTIVSTISLFLTGKLNYHLLLTVEELVISFLLAAVVGVAVGFVITSRRFLTDVAEPIMLALFTIPIAVVYPLIAVSFGLGIESKILFGGLYAFFPITTNTIAGVRSTDRSLVKLSKSMGASPTQIFGKVVIPGSIPTIIAGLRSGINLAFVGIIFGEMFASLGGLGFLINSYAEILDSEKAFGLIGIGLVITLIMNVLFRGLERHYMKWRQVS